MQINKRPLRVMFPEGSGKTKVDYLAHGFRLWGIPIIYSRALRDEAIEGQLYPIVLDFGAGHHKKAWFDIAATRYKKHLEKLEEKNTVYFKTHMARMDRRKDPRYLPMPQAVSSMQYMNAYQELRKLRAGRKEFLYDVLAVFVNSDDGLRQKVVQKLNEMTDLKILAKMISHPRLQDRPDPPPEIRGEKLRYFQHLKLQAMTKICIALPGAWKNGGASISFRHSEIWGMGGVVASIRAGTVMLGDPGRLWIEFRKDLGDFEDKIREALQDDKGREAMARTGAKYWDAIHHPLKAAYYMAEEAGGTPWEK